MFADKPGDVLDGRGLIDCGFWIAAPRTRWGPYMQTQSYGMFWVLEGSAVVESEGRSFEMSPNAIHCSVLNVPHAVRWDRYRPTRYGWMDFVPEPGTALPRFRPPAADDILVPLLQHMVTLSMEKPPDWAISIKLVYEYALRIFVSGNSRVRVSGAHIYSELVIRTLSIVQRQWNGGEMRTPALSELATELGVTARHLGRVFERELGFGPITVFRTLRILRSARLLVETSSPIAEIAARVGFDNHYHFSRVFRATIGLRPGEYRKLAPETVPVPSQIEQLMRYF